jgi:uncharacterized protein (DUF1778 family)
MFDSHAWEDGRGQFPVVIKARTTIELREAIKQAAALEHLTTGEFIRRVLSERASTVTGSPRAAGQQGHQT